MTQIIKTLPATGKAWVRSLGWEDPLLEGKTTLSSILAWRIPWTEEPGGLHSPWSPKELDVTEWISTIVWEEARVWAHLNYFFDMHFRAGILFFFILSAFRAFCWGLQELEACNILYWQSSSICHSQERIWVNQTNQWSLFQLRYLLPQPLSAMAKGAKGKFLSKGWVVGDKN